MQGNRSCRFTIHLIGRGQSDNNFTVLPSQPSRYTSLLGTESGVSTVSKAKQKCNHDRSSGYLINTYRDIHGLSSATSQQANTA